MIALPSIAFEGFSGSAKGVTARRVGGRNILSVKAWPTGPTTNAQLARRTSMSKISKSWKQLTNEQMREWDRLAEHTSGQSVFGQKAELTGMNLYIRLNVNRAMAGEALLSTAPESTVAVPNVEYSQISVTPELVAITGIKHQASPYKLVVKMSAGQSAGISNGWSKTVIITPGIEDDWGEADVTTLYLKTIGVEPVPGQKVFVESYWMDTSTGFAGQPVQDSVIVTGEAPYQRRVKATMDNLDPNEESHVSSLDVDFSTGAPVAEFNAMCLGHSNVASSEVYLDQQLPAELIGTGICLGRGNGADGKIIPQSYLVYIRNYGGKAEMTFAHRGGYYVKPTECFGSGIIY
ncbi:MAG: hypothetical protein K5652_04785 [Bacteroidales bacterium]|nr:hypothetical protein [Bacteroidales bacterium]